MRGVKGGGGAGGWILVRGLGGKGRWGELGGVSGFCLGYV